MTDLKTSGLGLWREMEDAAGKCRRPVRLRGRLTECDPVTGEVIHVMDSIEHRVGARNGHARDVRDRPGKA